MRWNRGMFIRSLFVAVAAVVVFSAVAFTEAPAEYYKRLAVVTSLPLPQAYYYTPASSESAHGMRQTINIREDEHGCDCGGDLTPNEVVALRFPKK